MHQLKEKPWPLYLTNNRLRRDELRGRILDKEGATDGPIVF